MAKTEVHHPDKAVSTGAYSAGVLIDGWLFINGQGPIDLATGTVIPGTIEEETSARAFSHRKDSNRCRLPLRRCREVYLPPRGYRDFDDFNRTYSTFFSGVRPARTTVQSVLWGGIKVEIDAIARVPSR